MKTLRIGSRGAEVRTLIRKINRVLGYPILRSGQTFTSDVQYYLAQCQEQLSWKISNLNVDGVYGPKTRLAFDEYEAGLARQTLVDPIGTHPDVVDIRGGKPPRLADGWQDLSHIKGITIHQTGCQIGDDPERIRRLNSTFYLSKRGRFYLVHDPRVFIWHAQGLSYDTVSLEVEGNYEGIIGRPSSLWKPTINGGPDLITDRMVMGAESGIRYITALFYVNGLTFRFINGHRQSSSMRVNDPGEDIWDKIALAWSKRLCLPNADRYGFPASIYREPAAWAIGGGSPIPTEWDPRRYIKKT